MRATSLFVVVSVVLDYPFAVTEQGYDFSVETDTVDVDVFGAYHEVDVLDTAVHAVFVKLFGSHAVASLYGCGVACAESKVTACVFVKQSVEEQNSAFRNGGILADECDFAGKSRYHEGCGRCSESLELLRKKNDPLY